MFKLNNMIKVAGLLLLTLISACSTVPKNLQVTENTKLIEYSDASKNTNQLIGQKARWGGVIATIKHKEKQTLLELVQYETYDSSKPKPSDESLGRFRVYVDGFLEPKIYKQGRLVSVLGTLAASEKGKIDEQTVVYPVLKDVKIYLWPELKEADRFDHWRDPFWPYSSRWYWNRYHYIQPYYIPKPNRTTHKKSTKKMVQ